MSALATSTENSMDQQIKCISITIYSNSLETLILYSMRGKSQQYKGGTFIVTLPNVQKKLENNPQLNPSHPHNILPNTNNFLPKPQT